MPINIIDGFNVNASAPVDYRIVASNSTDRDAITYKYDGLKVFVLSNRVTYTYNTVGATWSADISGVAGKIAMFNTTNTLKESIIGQFLLLNGAFGVLTLGASHSLMLGNGTVSILAGTGTLTTRAGDLRLIGGLGQGTGLAGNVYISGGQPDGNVYLGYNTTGFVGNIGIRTTTFDSGYGFQVDPKSAFNDTVRFKQPTETTNGSYFYNSTISLTSSAYIRSTNNYSTHLLPDYTWFNNDLVGLFHPSLNTLGISIAGATSAIFNSSKQLELNKSTSASLPSLTISGDTNTGIGQLTADGVDTLGLIVGGNKKITIRTFEVSADIHATGGATGNYLNPAIGSGSYLPVISSTTNVSSSSIGTFYWARVGNIISVSGLVIIAPTSGSAVTAFSISLPASTVMGSFGGLSGVGSANNIFTLAPTNIAASIYGDTSKAKISFTATTTTSWSWNIHFQYCVLNDPLAP